VNDEAQGPAPEDAIFAGWDELSWEQRRERRVQRWRAPGVEFASDEVRRAYGERVQILLDALALKVPARVPLFPMLGFYMARYAGFSPARVMDDYDALERSFARFHEDFLPDYQQDAIASARVFAAIGARYVDWPGRGVDDETPWQYVEAEYMKAEEYEALIADPSAYFMRTLLPRFAAGFAPLAALDPFSDIIEAATLPYSLLPFGDPEVAAGLRRLADAGEAAVQYVDRLDRISADLSGRLGLPVPWGGMVKAPYDILADTLRGTRGVAVDRFRRPAQLRAAAERFVPLQIDAGRRQLEGADAPLIFIPLHKGADGFMSDADFREIYWPTLKAVLLGLIAEGIVPALFAEGGYDSRLAVIADDELPAGSVLWWFDQTDMAQARAALRGRACIAGNVPGALLALGTGEQVETYVRALLDAVAGEGGFVLGSGVVVDDATPETMHALIETGRRWPG
jgi:hypothetical protein